MIWKISREAAPGQLETTVKNRVGISENRVGTFENRVGTFQNRVGIFHRPQKKQTKTYKIYTT